MHFNSHRELNLCFRLINGSFIWYALYTPEIFRQLLSNYSRYAAHLNMNAIRFLTHLVYYTTVAQLAGSSICQACSILSLIKQGNNAKNGTCVT